MAKGKVTSTSQMAGFRGKNMAKASGPSGKALPGGGKSMVQNLPKVGGKATGSQVGS
jgi:hypothetical protein